MGSSLHFEGIRFEVRGFFRVIGGGWAWRGSSYNFMTYCHSMMTGSTDNTFAMDSLPPV